MRDHERSAARPRPVLPLASQAAAMWYRTDLQCGTCRGPSRRVRRETLKCRGATATNTEPTSAGSVGTIHFQAGDSGLERNLRPELIEEAGSDVLRVQQTQPQSAAHRRSTGWKWKYPGAS
eukprot:530714-Rhodomonas_salina.1